MIIVFIKYTINRYAKPIQKAILSIGLLKCWVYYNLLFMGLLREICNELSLSPESYYMNCILLPKNVNTISDPKQITHIKEVLKSSVGDSLTIAEIGGNIGKATIAQINNNEVQLRDVTLDKKPPAKLDLTVVLALPRPKVLRRLIMDMTSLGVNKLIIVNSYRSQKSYWQSPLLNRIDEFIPAIRL